MIFVLLGTQPHHFSRLLVELEELVAMEDFPYGKEEIVIQAGATPETKTDIGSYYTFMNKGEYDYYMKSAEIIITHGGAGSIFDALNLNKKIIALPRRKDLNEHVDNHQQELVAVLAKNNYLIAENTLKESFEKLKTFTFLNYKKNREKGLHIISEYLNEE